MSRVKADIGYKLQQVVNKITRRQYLMHVSAFLVSFQHLKAGTLRNFILYRSRSFNSNISIN